jgi:MerR family transcriptional regulator, thiopeptide resistance regulator
MAAPATSYSVREFAELAGVTVKALHHYDRLGLLTPIRTESGYRRYRARDLSRLEDIAALRLLGIPLREIRTVLSGDVEPLRAILTRQRAVLERKRRVIDRALAALDAAEERLASAAAAAAPTLHDIIGAIGMPDIDAMRKYFSDDEWAVWKTHFEDWPPLEWRELFRDVGRVHAADPAGAEAQALADRWLALNEATPKPPRVRAGMRRAWLDRDNWPPEMKRRLAQFDVENAVRFMAEALWLRWDQERAARERAGEAPPRVAQTKRDLFRDWTAILGDDPAGPRAQALLDRWRALIEWETGGDEEMKARIAKGFENRRLWPLGLKRYHATLFETDVETWERVTDLIERAGACTAVLQSSDLGRGPESGV